CGRIGVDPAGDEILMPLEGGYVFVQLGAMPLAIGSVSPAQAAAGATVTILGSGFGAGLTATICGKAASCVVNSPESVACAVPAGLAAGPAAVSLTGADGETAVLPVGFSVQ
ncbi:MAG: IPT/TIG domain-containing protein, partial [Terriglobales bacterium]